MVLTSVYGPCDAQGKEAFMNWFDDIQMLDEVDWLIVGDLNLIRKLEGRNWPGGQVDRFRKHCLWWEAEESNRTNAKAAWTMVTRPKEQGGLGVLDLNSQIEALLPKRFNKF